MLFLLQRLRPKIEYKSTPTTGRSANTKTTLRYFEGDLFSIKITNEIPTIVIDKRTPTNVYNEIYDVFNRKRTIDTIVNINSNWTIGFFISI